MTESVLSVASLHDLQAQKDTMEQHVLDVQSQMERLEKVVLELSAK